jgi:probable HAF family extracellular repeat protein
VWNNGAVTQLANLAGGISTDAEAINDAGEVVGNATVPLGSAFTYHAFVWENGVTLDLNDVTNGSLGWTLVAANDINSNGAITGWGTVNSERHGFLLTPIPEPDLIPLVFMTAIMLASSSRRGRHNLNGIGNAER